MTNRKLQLAFEFDRAAITPVNSDIEIAPEFHYQLIRSKRKTLGITVHRGSVEVRAPLKAPAYWIEEFIAEKSAWIASKVAEQSRQLQEIYRIANDGIIPLLGEDLTIKISSTSALSGKPVKRGGIRKTESELRIEVPASIIGIHHQTRDERSIGSVTATATRYFLKWIKSEASNYMSPKTQWLASQMGLGDKLGKINYRKTSSKWGHCTSEGNIQYNPLILLAPVYVIDYIVAHEVCHLKHSNHSKTYWKLVDSICPDRHVAEDWLKQQGHKLSIEEH